MLDAVVKDHDGSFRILEHKTAARRWTEDKLAYDNQITAYGLAAPQLGLGDATVTVQLLLKQKAPDFEMYTPTRTDADRRDLVNTAVGVLRAVKAGAFWCNRDWMCKTCEYAARCVAGRIYAVIPVIIQRKEAQEMRIAVLSDQHIDTEVAPESWTLAKDAFKAVAVSGADHIVLAGDTFDCATAMLRDRSTVRRYLKRLGLWHRDRLTILPGNHDIFHTAHHGDWRHIAAEFTGTGDAQDVYDEFCNWAGDVVWSEDCLAG